MWVSFVKDMQPTITISSFHQTFHPIILLMTVCQYSQFTSCHISLILKVKDGVYDILLLSFNFHILKPGSMEYHAICEKHYLGWRGNLQFLFANLIRRENEMHRLMEIEQWSCQVEDFKTWRCKRHYYSTMQVWCSLCLTSRWWGWAILPTKYAL